MEKNIENEVETGMICVFGYQDPPGTLNWGHMASNSRYLGTDRKQVEGLGPSS